MAGFHDGPAGIDPVTESAGVRGAEALPGEHAGCHAGTAAGGAVEEDLAVLGLREEFRPLGARPGEIAERQEAGPLGHATAPLVGLAAVDEERLAGPDARGAIERGESGGGSEGGTDHLQELHAEGGVAAARWLAM